MLHLRLTQLSNCPILIVLHAAKDQALSVPLDFVLHELALALPLSQGGSRGRAFFTTFLPRPPLVVGG